MPLMSTDSLPKTTTSATIQFIQRVIPDTSTPSWINSVPANYGEANAGTIKADEWRTLSTLHIPIALVILWGDIDGAAPKDGSRFLRILDHSMALFQAIIIVCRYATNPTLATKFRSYIKEWVNGLHDLHPHTKKHQRRTNVHMSFQLYDFLLLFGRGGVSLSNG